MLPAWIRQPTGLEGPRLPNAAVARKGGKGKPQLFTCDDLIALLEVARLAPTKLSRSELREHLAPLLRTTPGNLNVVLSKRCKHVRPLFEEVAL